MKNKDFEKLYKNLPAPLMSEDLKGRVLCNARKIPIIEKPINGFFVTVRRYAALLSALIVTLIAAVTLLGFYNESYYEVYIDINPSISVSVNRFGVVNKVTYLNEDAKKCLGDVDLKGQTPEEAVDSIVYALSENGYLAESEELFISGYSVRAMGISELIESLYFRMADLAEANGFDIEVFRGEFTAEEREAAQNANVSPLKYSLIKELIALDDAYTVEELSTFSMGDLNNICRNIRGSLSEALFEISNELDISPVRCQLLSLLMDLGVDKTVFENLDTKALKKLYADVYQEYKEKLNAELTQKAEEYNISLDKMTVIHSIVSKDDSYTVEDLLDKSILELRAIDYALTRYEHIKDLFS